MIGAKMADERGKKRKEKNTHHLAGSMCVCVSLRFALPSAEKRRY